MNRPEPRVSVLVRAHNVEPWIRTCLDSILAQETNFEVEILVTDDAATDGTPDILRRYAELHPGQIRVFLQSANQHSLGLNSASPLVAIARGEFLALCDGDDYWTNPHKLQIQVNLLDRDPSLSIVMHQSDLLNEDGLVERGKEGCTIYSLRHFVKQMAVGSASSSILCRHTQEIRAAFSGAGLYEPNGIDWLLCVGALQTGELCFLHQSMSIYRIRSGSLYSTRSWIDQFRLHRHCALRVSLILGDRWKPQILNFNKRRLLLRWADPAGPKEVEQIRNEFVRLETNPILRSVTFFLMSSPMRRIYGRMFSKIFYWNLAVSI